MIDEQIRIISEIHRMAMDSHYNYMRLLSQSNTFLRNPVQQPVSTTQQTNDFNFGDVIRTNLPPITIDLTHLFNTTLSNNPLLPTNDEIENACELLTYSEIPENERTTIICPIDRQPFQQNDNVLRINHCKHYFREGNLRQNFQTSSLCPLCRHNIISQYV
jgi:hypothetical protein